MSLGWIGILLCGAVVGFAGAFTQDDPFIRVFGVIAAVLCIVAMIYEACKP